MTDEQATIEATIEVPEPFDAAYAARFDAVYRNNAWGGVESHSLGPNGVASARDDLAPLLVSLVGDYGIEAVLDVGCGDSVWTPDLPGYIGVDVSPAALAAARERHPDRDFRLYEGGDFPAVEGGLVLCKHVLQHMSPADGVVLLDRIRATGAKWLLASTYPKGANDVQHAFNGHNGYWPNLSEAPFSLGRPRKTFKVAHVGAQDVKHGGMLGLWKIA